MYHTGTDIIEITRIQEAINHWGGASFTDGMLTPSLDSAKRGRYPWRHDLPVRQQSLKPWEQQKEGLPRER